MFLLKLFRITARSLPMVGDESLRELMCEKSDVGIGWWKVMDYLLSHQRWWILKPQYEVQIWKGSSFQSHPLVLTQRQSTSNNDNPG